MDQELGYKYRRVVFIEVKVYMDQSVKKGRTLSKGKNFIEHC